LDHIDCRVQRPSLLPISGPSPWSRMAGSTISVSSEFSCYLLSYTCHAPLYPVTPVHCVPGWRLGLLLLCFFSFCVISASVVAFSVWCFGAGPVCSRWGSDVSLGTLFTSSIAFFLSFVFRLAFASLLGFFTLPLRPAPCQPWAPSSDLVLVTYRHKSLSLPALDFYYSIFCSPPSLGTRFGLCFLFCLLCIPQALSSYHDPPSFTRE